MGQRRRLACNESQQDREYSEEEQRHNQQEDHRRQEQYFVHVDVLEEAAGEYLAPVIQLPEYYASDDEEADVQIVSMDEWQCGGPRRPQLEQQYAAPCLHRRRYGVDDETGKTRKGCHDERHGAYHEGEKRAIRHLAEEGQGARQGHARNGQEGSDDHGKNRHRQPFERVDAEYPRRSHPSRPQQRGIRLPAAHKVGDHHHEEEEHRRHHQGLQQEQRHS